VPPTNSCGESIVTLMYNKFNMTEASGADKEKLKID
jgi:hypothetical protein